MRPASWRRSQEVLHQPNHEDGQVEHKEGYALGVLVRLHVALGQGVVEEVEQLRPVVDLLPVPGGHHAGPWVADSETSRLMGKGGLEEQGSLRRPASCPRSLSHGGQEVFGKDPGSLKRKKGKCNIQTLLK